MAVDLPLACRCGKVRGQALGVAPGSVNRVICHCDDCQAFATHLGGDDILDAHAGTDIAQLPPCNVKLTEGLEHVALLRLSPRGLFRWHTSCCNTPIGNTATGPGMAFVGLVHTFVDHSEHPREEVMGPPRGRVHGRFIPLEQREGCDAHPKASVGLLAATAAKLAAWKLSGKARPHPFFTDDGQPIAEPVVLTKEQRFALPKGLPEER